MDDSERLRRFEQLLAELKDEQSSIDYQIEDLQAKGKTKTATFKQLLARKLTLNQFLDAFAKHGL